MQRGFIALFLLAAAGLIGLASGCGGGDDGNGSTTRTIAGNTITVPTVSTPSNTSTGTKQTTTLPSTITLPNGTRIQTSELTPFRDCLRSHGVQPGALGRGQSGGLTPDRIKQLQAQTQARVACAPELPQPLRGNFERYIQQQKERLKGR